jgi:hypothetical protein
MKPSRLILNGVNGRYLREICDNALDECDLVEAAVAYASDERLLFDWCLKFEIPLKYWGRFDPTLPVSPRILKKFLDRRSPNFTCKLLTHFHSKVIWWHGVGAYIGSANLSDPAWNGNIEAGCFFSEGDLEASGTDLQLRDFFLRVDAQATPLTEELYKVIEARAKELNAIADRDHESRKKFLSASSIKQWGGLLAAAPKAASERKKAAFLTEWFDTLQTLRDIGKRISNDQNRPKWLTAEVPYGAQADQFLHAHYYHDVIDEHGKSRFAEHFEKNKADPERALREAIAWWRSLPTPPGKEDRMLYEWAPALRRELAVDRILTLTEKDFEQVCERVWSIQDHGRRVSNETLRLVEGVRHPMTEKTKALAQYLFGRRAPNGSTVLQTIYHVLYGGNVDDVPLRLWDATGDGSWRIEHLGISALGEIIGWALPDNFPPRNNRTSKSLRSLGFEVSAY